VCEPQASLLGSQAQGHGQLKTGIHVRHRLDVAAASESDVCAQPQQRRFIRAGAMVEREGVPGLCFVRRLIEPSEQQVRLGRDPPVLRPVQGDSAVGLDRRPSRDARAPIASQFDADLFRAFIEMTSLLALPSEVMARPGLVDRILEVAGSPRPHLRACRGWRRSGFLRTAVGTRYGPRSRY
jgi:hypothetical protein